MQHRNHIWQIEAKGNPFCVPHGYFDLLPQRMGEKIGPTCTQGRTHLHTTLSFKKRLRAQLSLAASLILMIGLGYGMVRLITPNHADTDLSYTENISLLSSYTLLQDNEWDNALDSEEIISYLTDHGVSPNAIAYLD